MKKLLALMMVLCLFAGTVSLAHADSQYYTSEHYSVKLPDGVAWEEKKEENSGMVYYYPNGDTTGMSGAIMILEQDIGYAVSESTLPAAYDLMVSEMANSIPDGEVNSEESTLGGRISRYFTVSAKVESVTMKMTGNAVCFDQYMLAICYLVVVGEDKGPAYIREMSDATVFTAGGAAVEPEPVVEPEPTAEPAAVQPNPQGAPSSGKEILFRNVPWGSTLADLPALLGGVEVNDPYPWKYWYSMDSMMFNESGGFRHEAEIGATSSVSYSAYKEMKVAGYGLKDIELYFAYIPDAEGNLIRDNAHLGLFFASYQLDSKDPKAAFEDLKGKLTGLYGEPAGTQHDDGYGYIVSDQVLWTGANGTMVSLVLQDYPEQEMTNLYIKYGTAEGDTMLDTAFAAAQAEESRNAEGDVDGL